jgi:Protein of unknown function (DUF1292).
MSKHGDNCDCGCGDQYEEMRTITLTTEEDNEVECAILTTFPVGENMYIALLPLSEEDNSDDEEGSVYLYRYVELENDEIELINIIEDDEYEAASEAFDQYLDEQEFDEMFDEDEE